jgi:hypothetical protein
MSTSIFKNVGIALTSSSSLKQNGGGPKISNPTHGRHLLLMAFIWTVSLLIIKVLLVHWSWNYIGPRLIPQNYRQLTIADSTAVVILVQALFN